MNKLLLVPVLAIAFSVVFTNASGQASYQSNASGNWSSPSTWIVTSGVDGDGDGIPDANDNVTIVSTHTVTLTGSITCTNFSMSSSTASLNCGGNTFGATGSSVISAGSFTNGTVNLTGSTTILGSATGGPIFDVTLTANSDVLTFTNTIFLQSTTLQKNGPSHVACAGGNTWFSDVTFIQSGNGEIIMGSSLPDIIFGNASFQVTSASGNRMHFADNSSGNIIAGTTTVLYNGTNLYSNNFHFAKQWGSSITFGGDVSVLCNNGASSAIKIAASGHADFLGNLYVSRTNGSGVYIGDAGGTVYFDSGKRVMVGAQGFNGGTLKINGLTHAGSTPQSIALTGSAVLEIGLVTGCTFTGNCVFTAPTINCYYSTFNGAYTLSASLSVRMLGNTVTGSASITTSGLQVETNSFNTSSGSTSIYRSGSASAASNGNNIFYGNLDIYNSGSTVLDMANTTGPDIYWGSVNLDNSGTAAIEMSRTFSSSYYNTITLNSSNTGGIIFGINGGTSSQNATSVSTGTFSNGPLKFFSFTQASGSQQNLLTLTGSATLQVGAAGTGSDFGGSWSSAVASSTTLISSFFRQQFTSTSATYTIQNNTFNDVSGTCSITKTGTSADNSNGGNIFNGAATVTISATAGSLRMGSTSSDDYNADVTFIQSNAGVLAPSYNTTCTYAGSITAGSPAATAITFGSGTSGISMMDGGNAVTINKTAGSADPVFTRLTINKTANVTLNTKVNVSTILTLTSGLINTTAASILAMKNASTTTIGSSISYINGPMSYDMAVNGTRTLNFPVGKSPDWRPAVLTASHSANTSYTYTTELFNASALALNWTLPATVDTVSNVHYWDITRTLTGGAASNANLSGNQTIKLYFDSNDGVMDGTYLTIVKNTSAAPTTWIDIGGTGAPAYTGSPLTGNVTSTSSPSAFNSFSRFTLGSRLTGWNPLPIELVSFTAACSDNKVNLDWLTATEVNNDHFDVLRSRDGAAFEYVTAVDAYGDGNSISLQEYQAIDPFPYEGVSYYRLRQVDHDGTTWYSNIVPVEFKKNNNGISLSVYPNPSAGHVTALLDENLINEQTSLEVINILGEKVLSIGQVTSSSIALDLTHLPPGVYFMIVKDAATQHTERFVIGD